MPLPRYVERGGDIVAPAPYTARAARTYAFILPADRATIDALLARSFREPSGGAVDIQALGPFVFLTASRIGSLRPSNPPHRDYGQASEIEIAVWVPGVDVGRNQMVWFHPYMFVDQHLALAAGREVYGFPKQLGTIGIAGDAARPVSITLEVVAIERFGADAWAEPHDLVGIWRGESPPPPPLGPFDTEAAALDAFAERLEATDVGPAFSGMPGVGRLGEMLQLILRLVRDTAAGRMPMMFLKQFRDAVEPDRACYQKIIEARTRRLKFHDFGFLGEYTVTIKDLASEPLRTDLGLRAGPITPIASIRLDDDFEMMTGTVRWP